MPFLKHVPCSGSRTATVPIQVHEITLAAATQVGRGRIWHQTVQPFIARTPSRPDATWNWRGIIPALMLVVGPRRGGRLFQMTVGTDEKPAAMVALLDNERWYADPTLPATFLWFLSTAPQVCLDCLDDQGRTQSPRLIGKAAFDIALTIALAAPGNGRIWLHADQKGGDDLLRWYTEEFGMRKTDPALYPRLPAGRINDGRYLFLDEHGAVAAHRALSLYRK